MPNHGYLYTGFGHLESKPSLFTGLWTSPGPNHPIAIQTLNDKLNRSPFPQPSRDPVILHSLYPADTSCLFVWCQTLKQVQQHLRASFHMFLNLPLANGKHFDLLAIPGGCLAMLSVLTAAQSCVTTNLFTNASKFYILTVVCLISTLCSYTCIYRYHIFITNASRYSKA